MFALYLLTLGLSAGIFGLFAHHLLADQGFVPVFRAGLALALGMALLYVTIQTAYMLLIRLYKPTKDATFHLLEALSQLAALVLLPFVLRMDVPWPWQPLERLEPLLFLAAFLALHAFLKLVSFFGAVRGLPASRKGALGWAGAFLLSGLLTYGCLTAWAGTVESIRPVVTGNPEYRPAGGQYALSWQVGEGSMLTCELESAPGRGVTFLLAPDPEAIDDPVGEIHATLVFQGENGGVRHSRELRLHRTGWTPLRLGPDELPQGVKSCRLVWNAGEAAPWEKFSGVLPVVTTSRRLLVAGPQYAEPRREDSGPNLVVLAIEGLRPGRGLPYGPEARPLAALLRLAAVAIGFDNAYAPAPDPVASLMTLLTGQPPLRHGFLGPRRGPLSPDLLTLPQRLRQQGYATAAFTQGDAADGGDLTFNSGFERGFDLFDPTGYDGPIDAAVQVGDAVPVGEEAATTDTETLDRARAWLDDYRDTKFMLFVRLRPGPVATETDNAAARAWDSALAELIRALRDVGNTCIVVTSPCGAVPDEPGASPAEFLTERALRVPLLLYVPGLRAGARSDILSFDELAVVLLRLAEGETDFIALPDPEPDEHGGPAKVKAPEPFSTEAVALWGEPLALSLRKDRWRLTWQTQATLDNPVPGEGGELALYDVARMRSGGAERNVAARNKQTVSSLQRQLRTYLRTFADAEAQAR